MCATSPHLSRRAHVQRCASERACVHSSRSSSPSPLCCSLRTRCKASASESPAGPAHSSNVKSSVAIALGTSSDLYRPSESLLTIRSHLLLQGPPPAAVSGRAHRERWLTQRQLDSFSLQRVCQRLAQRLSERERVFAQRSLEQLGADERAGRCTAQRSRGRHCVQHPCSSSERHRTRTRHTSSSHHATRPVLSPWWCRRNVQPARSLVLRRWPQVPRWHLRACLPSRHDRGLLRQRVRLRLEPRLHVQLGRQPLPPSDWCHTRQHWRDVRPRIRQHALLHPCAWHLRRRHVPKLRSRLSRASSRYPHSVLPMLASFESHKSALESKRC